MGHSLIKSDMNVDVCLQTSIYHCHNVQSQACACNKVNRWENRGVVISESRSEYVDNALAC